MLAPSSGGRGRVYRLTACKKEQQGVVLADEGLRGQQEGGGELRRFPFGDSYGTCVMWTLKFSQKCLFLKVLKILKVQPEI